MMTTVPLWQRQLLLRTHPYFSNSSYFHCFISVTRWSSNVTSEAKGKALEPQIYVYSTTAGPRDTEKAPKLNSKPSVARS